MADLTTVARVKSYLDLSTAGVDSLIARLIAPASRLIEQYTSRTFPYVARNNRRINGSGTPVLTLPDQPIVAVSALSVGSISYTESVGANTTTGYTFDTTSIYLTDGTKFVAGLKNVTVSYVAGYAGEETDDIPSGNTPTLSPTSDSDGSTGAGLPVVNISVVAENGTVFAQVDATPGAGEYTFANGTYTFNTADANTSVTMSYYYVPAPVEQACIEMVGLDVRQRTTLGQKSQSLGQQTVSIETLTMPTSIKQMLNPYRRMAPV